jgi:hypothetical protein
MNTDRQAIAASLLKLPAGGDLHAAYAALDANRKIRLGSMLDWIEEYNSNQDGITALLERNTDGRSAQ